ncbi:MAG: hypothetical protein KJ740_23500 [Gammaproteobacteria bacterium]|nr:hypothetical protein [Gammaproteobacteria bacterium]
MAYFFRLIFALTALFASTAHADQDYTEYRICSAAGCQYFDSQWVGSAASANSAYWSWMDSTQPACSNNYNHFDYVPAGVNTEQTYGQGTRTQTEYSITGCTGNAFVYPPTTQSVQIMKRISTCLSPNVVVDNSCVPPPPPCEPPNVIKDGVCGPPDPPKCAYPPGAPMPDTLFQMGGGANYKGGYICYLNCEAVPNMRAQKGGNWYHWGPYTSTGATCATGTGDATGGQPTPGNPDGVPPTPDPNAPPRDPPPPPPEPPPEQCKKGTCPGQINGVTVCMPCEEIRSGQPTPGGSPNSPPAPPDPTGNNAPPDTQNTTQSATNCKDGKCTTTTTKSTTDANGVTTTNSHTKTESQDDFCTTNPRSSMCIDGVFGGACSGGFACEGDAVQCAIAKEQHVRNCKLFEDYDNEEAQLYQTEKGKEGSVLGSLEGNITKTIGASDFDTSDALGAGATCIANKSINVMGTSILIPFSDICPYLAILGNILMSVSFLLAGRIVMRG